MNLCTILGIIIIMIVVIVNYNKISMDAKTKNINQNQNKDITENSQNQNNDYIEPKKEQPINQNNMVILQYPYIKRNLLTKNEYIFYRHLLEITEKYNLSIITKVRLADIIEVDKNRINKTDYMKYFGKIKAKHLDFVIVEKYTYSIIAAIELDDRSHKRQDRYERDVFVNNALLTAKIPLIRCYNAKEIEMQLMKILNIQENTANIS